ncbi:MAG: hypothetical protein Q8O66_00915 [bacterium]|nr:hypothetical protein [bacterium]
MKNMINIIKNLNKNTIITAVAIIGVIIVGVLIAKPNISFSNLLGSRASAKEIAQKSVDYINSSGLSQTPATLSGEVSEESGLIKFKIKIGTEELDSYATKDGKLLLPQAFNMGDKKIETVNNQPSDEQKQQAATSVTKSDSPVLEAYIVSRCPYGLQMQRAMSEAFKSMPDLAKYMKVMYMGSVTSDGKNITAMHGEAEAKENLRQICIREEQPAKYWNYSACQMKSSGQEVACEKSTGVDSSKLNSCMSDSSRGVAYAKKDFDLNTKYNVKGSPTMVLGNAVISENSFGGRSADGVKSMICSGFNNQPSFCTTKLSTSPAAASFSESTTSGSGTGNSGANGTNCAPAQ